MILVPPAGKKCFQIESMRKQREMFFCLFFSAEYGQNESLFVINPQN